MSRAIFLIQLGVGRVGMAVAHIINEQSLHWHARYNLQVRYYALADSTAFLAGTDAALRPEVVDAALAAHEQGRAFVTLPNASPISTWEQILAGALAVAAEPADVIVLDCAAGTATVPLLLAARAAGASAVLANKDPLTGPLAQYQALVGPGDATRRVGSLRISATVGAGLPIAATLAACVAAGDSVIELSARASGSLGFLCDELSQGIPFDQALQAAMARGYTEPDPRQDLSGFDVARKLLILARTAGTAAELSDVQVENLTPHGSETLSLEEFTAAIPTYSAYLAARATCARSSERVLRYTAQMDNAGLNAGLRAGLVELPPDGPLAQGAGPGNVFLLRTRRYDANPLLIAGPGAGIEVTAGAVVSDVLRAVGVL